MNERASFPDEELPGHGSSVHALRIDGAGAHFEDDGGVAGDGERIWVAVAHRPGGRRGYSGLATDPDAALSGAIDTAGLDEHARRGLRRALLDRDPDAWDDAAEALRRALGEHV